MDSYPPHLLRLPGSAPGSPARGALEGGQPATVPAQQSGSGHQVSRTLVATAGQPGAYEPAVTPQERPRNVTELGEHVTPATPEPWPAGAYVLVGERGKRGHWTGSSWKGGDSPGYPGAELATVRSATEQTTDGEQ